MSCKLIVLPTSPLRLELISLNRITKLRAIEKWATESRASTAYLMAIVLPLLRSAPRNHPDIMRAGLAAVDAIDELRKREQATFKAPENVDSKAEREAA